MVSPSVYLRPEASTLRQVPWLLPSSVVAYSVASWHPLVSVVEAHRLELLHLAAPLVSLPVEERDQP